MNIKQGSTLIIAIVLLFTLTACNLKSDTPNNSLEIDRKVYEYEKDKWNFTFQLENIGNASRISYIVKNLVYNGLGFDEYVSSIEKDIFEAMDEYELANPRDSYLSEKYTIKYVGRKYIVVSFFHEEHDGYAPHPNYWYNYFIIDLAEERVLAIDEILDPIPDDILLGFIYKQYEEEVDIYKDTLWPPNLISLDGENTALIWNTYSLLPHAYGPVMVSDYQTITQYLTPLGKQIIKLNMSTATPAKTDTIKVSPTQPLLAPEAVFQFADIPMAGGGYIGTITKYIGTDTNVIIPRQIYGIPVKAIGEYSFAKDPLREGGITSVTIPEGITQIGVSAFVNNLLTSVAIPEGVTTIGARAFANNELASVTIPNTVTVIGEGAFFYNQLTSVTIPNSVAEIGGAAFDTNPLTSITIGANVKLGGSGNAFEGFDSVYNKGGKLAGTYTINDDVWSNNAETYKIGAMGPAGGIIFYDKGQFSEGWRFLEAAPAEYEFQSAWQFTGIAITGTDTGIGAGRSNKDIMKIMGYSEISDNAAYRCSQLEINGFKDWFLPSKDELNLMYIILHRNKMGGFSDDMYWSSSVGNEGKDKQWNSKYATWCQRFSDGAQHSTIDLSGYTSDTRTAVLYVRAIRAF